MINNDMFISCSEPVPYYVLVLALVCGGAALMSLISLATMIPFEIGRFGRGINLLATFQS